MNARANGAWRTGRAETLSENGRGNSLSRAIIELESTAEALHRCAQALQQLTGRDADVESGRSVGSEPRAQGRGVSPPLGERLSGRQLAAIRAISRRSGLSRNDLADLIHETAGKTEPALLTRQEASLVLDRLNSSSDSR